MTIPRTIAQQVPPGGSTDESAATADRRARAARAAYAIRDARHRREGQAALAASILKLSARRR